jgi:hypothetical protein
LATSESNRAIPPYQSGPYDRMGRGHREEDGGVEPADHEGRHRCSKPVAAPAAHLPRRRATDSNRCARALIRLRSDARGPGGFTLHVGSPTRCERAEMAEDGAHDAHGVTRRPFPAGADHLAGSSSEEGERLERYGFTRASASDGARRPGRFTFHECAGRESNPHARRHRFLKPARLPVTPPAHCARKGESDRPDSNRPCELGELAC